MAAEPYPPRYWLARLQVAGSVLVNVFIALTEALSLSSSAVRATGSMGWVCVASLGVLAGLALLDVIVNDLLPARIALPTFARYRHLVYMLLATGLVSITFVIASRVGYTTLLWAYWVDAAACVAIAFCDLFARHRQDHRA